MQLWFPKGVPSPVCADAEQTVWSWRLRWARPHHVSALSSCISMRPDSAAFNESHHRLYISDVNVDSLCILASGTNQDLNKTYIDLLLKKCFRCRQWVKNIIQFEKEVIIYQINHEMKQNFSLHTQVKIIRELIFSFLN